MRWMMLLAGSMLACQFNAGARESKPQLRAEVPFVVGAGYPPSSVSARDFLFVLLAGDNPVAVPEMNSLSGRGNRSFSATDGSDSSIQYRILRPPQDASIRAVPIVKIAAADILISKIDLADGTWRIRPKLSIKKTQKYSFIGHYVVNRWGDARPGVSTDSVWSGALTTNAFDVFIDTGLATKLNGPKTEADRAF
jgi:hypothetical protein